PSRRARRADGEGERDPVIAVSLALALLAGSGQDPLEGILAEAFANYRAGEYAAARDLYGRAVARGADGGEVRYNLGNCEARTGNWPAALAQYRRAQAYLPRDADVRHNVEVARRKLGLATPPPGLTDSLRAFLLGFTRGELLRATLLAEALFFGALVLRVLRPSPRARALSLGGGVLLLASLALLGHEVFLRSARRQAVVLAEAAARSEPRTDREELFRLRPGEELTILGSEGEWFRVKAPGRGVGWLPAGAVEGI
ncbi:MAG: SH3 domain-containing protein, partial [Planctomycetota bacterium]